MADKEADPTTEVENSAFRPPQQRGGFGAKVKRHSARFWWVHVIITIVVFLVIFLPIYYVAYPKIAQHKINQSRTNITALNLTSPSPSAFTLSQRAVLYSNSSYHPQLDAFNATLSLGGQSENPFGTVLIPATHSNGSANVVIEDQLLQLTNVSAYAEFCTAILGGETFELEIKGSPKLHEMSFPVVNVDYNPTVTLKGLNNLNGLTITNVSTPSAKQSDGANMLGTVTIPNPSVLTIALGDVGMNLFVLDSFLGTSTLANMTLYPGTNTLPMRAVVNETLILLNIHSFADGVVPIEVKANSSVYAGQHIGYYESALQSSSQTVNVNISSLLGGAAS